MLTHSDEYKFPCTECDKKFKQGKSWFSPFRMIHHTKYTHFSYKPEVTHACAYERDAVQMVTISSIPWIICLNNLCTYLIIHSSNKFLILNISIRQWGLRPRLRTAGHLSQPSSHTHGRETVSLHLRRVRQIVSASEQLSAPFANAHRRKAVWVRNMLQTLESGVIVRVAYAQTWKTGKKLIVHIKLDECQ